MHYHWGMDVGHFHTHALSSIANPILDQSMDVDTLDHAPTDTAGLIVGVEPGTDKSVDLDLRDPEMSLDECDLEGWDDMESDTSEDGHDDADYHSEDDEGWMYA